MGSGWLMMFIESDGIDRIGRAQTQNPSRMKETRSERTGEEREAKNCRREARALVKGNGLRIYVFIYIVSLKSYVSMCVDERAYCKTDRNTHTWVWRYGFLFYASCRKLTSERSMCVGGSLCIMAMCTWSHVGDKVGEVYLHTLTAHKHIAEPFVVRCGAERAA